MGLLENMRFTVSPTPEERDAKERARKAAEASADGYGYAEYTTKDGEKRIMATKKAGFLTRGSMSWPADEE